MSDPAVPASAECIICSTPAPAGSDYCGQVCRITGAADRERRVGEYRHDLLLRLV